MILKPVNLTSANALLPYVPGPGAYVAEANFFQTAFPLQFQLFQGATAVSVAPLDYFETLGRNQTAVQVYGTFVGTVLIEGSLDEQNWTTIASVTAEGITQVNGLYAAIRASVSAYTSGTISAYAISQRV